MRKTLFFILLFLAVFGYAQKLSTDTLKKDSILITKKLVIVNLNDASPNLNKTEIENYLNQVYSQAVVGWEVKRVENISLDKAIFGEDEQLDAGNSDLMSAYSQEQKDLVKAYQKDHELDKETYYIFVVPSLTGNIQGYMVRGGQVGFVSSQAQNLNRTIAHELGHGAFSLQHTFDDPKLPQGSTQNLMDYAQGTELWVSQWNYLRNPDIIFRPFEKDAEGMMAGGMTSKDCLEKLERLKPNLNKLSYLLLSQAIKQDKQTININKNSYRVGVLDIKDEGLKISYYEDAWKNSTDKLFKIELITKLENVVFWLSYKNLAPYEKSDFIDVTLYLHDTQPLSNEPDYCTREYANLARGKSAGVALSEVFDQKVALITEIISGGAAIKKSGSFVTGAGIDLGIQLAVLDIIKTYKQETFTTKDLLAEVSWPSVLYSGLTYNKNIPIAYNIFGAFTVGFADAITKEIIAKKSLDINLTQASYEGFKQALIQAGIDAVLQLIKIPAKYSKTDVENAFRKGAVKTSNILEKYRVAIFDKVKIITKDETLLPKIKNSFLDSFYYTGETIEEFGVFRRFGGNENQAKLFGGFATTEAVLSRNDLAILKEWSTMQFEAELIIEKGVKLNMGKIAPQSIYSGGVDQILLPRNYPEYWVKSIKDLKTGKVYSLEEFKKTFPTQIK